MKTLKFVIVALFSCVLLSLSSCGKDDEPKVDPEGGDTGDGWYTITVNGKDYYCYTNYYDFPNVTTSFFDNDSYESTSSIMLLLFPEKSFKFTKKVVSLYVSFEKESFYSNNNVTDNIDEVGAMGVDMDYFLSDDYISGSVNLGKVTDDRATIKFKNYKITMKENSLFTDEPTEEFTFNGTITLHSDISLQEDYYNSK